MSYGIVAEIAGQLQQTHRLDASQRQHVGAGGHLKINSPLSVVDGGASQFGHGFVIWRSGDGKHLGLEEHCHIGSGLERASESRLARIERLMRLRVQDYAL